MNTGGWITMWLDVYQFIEVTSRQGLNVHKSL